MPVDRACAANAPMTARARAILWRFLATSPLLALSCTAGTACPAQVPPSTCSPTTCAALGKDCGAVDDGCGHALDCGSCSAPQSCGGGGVDQVCGQGACTPPTITVQPRPATVAVGEVASFSVTATGTGTLVYQWRKRGIAIDGAAAPSYSAPAATAADDGAMFTVEVSVGTCTVMSAAATLTVTTAPVAPAITTQPGDATVAQGVAATFSVVASGTAPLTYQWRRNGTAIAGATSSSYTTPATSVDDDHAVFSVVVSNAAGSVTSGDATLHVSVAPPGEVTFAVSSAVKRPLSRFIYGLNLMEDPSWWGSEIPSQIALNRMGGDRQTTYNWETQFSNGGHITGSVNDVHYACSTPGCETERRIDLTFPKNAAFMATVPMNWVAADGNGSTTIPVAPSPLVPATPQAGRFKQAVPKNPGGPSTTPDTTDPYVYVDDYVAWLAAHYPAAATDANRRLFFSLDNEPDIWGDTHPELRGTTDPAGNGESSLFCYTGWDELVEKSTSTAAAVKDAAPQSLVFGPALALYNGFTSLHHYDKPDPAKAAYCADNPDHCWFLDYYLEGFKKADDAAGRRTLDVLDVHWYPQMNQVTNAYATQDDQRVSDRIQAPRSLWDPTYVETSWVSGSVPGCTATRCALKLLPDLQDLIDRRYPGTRIAITEYYYGRGGDISGGIAQADVLGIFGKYGVFAATAWPNESIWAYNGANGISCGGDEDCATYAYKCFFAAFRAYLDYDGSGAGFGDTSLGASTSDPAKTSVYAGMDAAHPERLVLVAINKDTSAISAGVALDHSSTLSTARVYQITGGIAACTGPTPLPGTIPVTGNAFTVTLPPMSISTIVLN